MSAVKKILLSLVCFTTGFLQTVYGHGYMTLPPSRSSAWRFGFGTPTNYDDNALYCGGFAVSFNFCLDVFYFVCTCISS